MTHVRNQDIAVEGEFTSNSMRLKLPIDLDDLLRDGRVLWVGKRDPDGTLLCVKLYCLEGQTAAQSTDDLTFYASHLGWST